MGVEGVKREERGRRSERKRKEDGQTKERDSIGVERQREGQCCGRRGGGGGVTSG